MAVDELDSAIAEVQTTGLQVIGLEDLVLNHHHQVPVVNDGVQHLSTVGFHDFCAPSLRKLRRQEHGHQLGVLNVLASRADSPPLSRKLGGAERTERASRIYQPQPLDVRERTHPQHKQQGPRELVLVPGDETLIRTEEIQRVSFDHERPSNRGATSCRAVLTP